ncbi:SDR family NAD(P)-dependent oxidoreductase [Verrucosispora sp. TAA-831]|uniref:SDR family NAD(P)-dependent oxidoreductase n=1 Tax=Verrucosispora sp. TAA-831 TaxID=3422227 RepID=UPI003D70054A
MTTSTEQLVEALRASLKENDRIRQDHHRLTAAASEPIAVVGMGGRFGGGVDSVAGLWDLLVSGGEVVGEFPADRGWDVEGLFDPDPGALGKSYVRFGGFVSGVADFDAEFFGISPREALAMDPQQRLFLETAWVALEDAGFDPADLRGSRTGVFAGLSGHDYGGSPGEVMEGVEGHLVTGNAASVLSGRLSYFFGWEGPAVTVDTACSSSLVALHLAVQALRQGECGLALVGGVSVMSTPALFLEFSRQRGLAVDGRCKAFSADADGMGAAEGAGVLVVERLSDARRNGHRILAVVRGSAVNQDGASNGLTAPNGPSQQRVIRQALVNAGVDAAGVDVVEAHGTGTRLGDPIEAQALQATYGKARGDGDPVLLGSVKSNIGHTQAAAGVAGVIKMILAMRHDLLPRTLHADVPSPEIDWSPGTLRLLTEAQPWKRNGHPRRAGVSSFGMSGTNAHAIIEDYTEAETVIDPGPPSAALPLVLSAASPAALREQAAHLADLLADASLTDVASSLVRTRGVLAERLVVVAADRAAGEAGLRSFAVGAPGPDVAAGNAPGRDERVVFVFPGQGAQWAGMGVALMAESPVFARRMAECEQALGPFVDWSLTEVLGDERALERVEVVQPALWAVMVSLAAVWRSWGVEPSAVVGHSQGEIAAACVAGALTLEDGARVVALRSAAIVRLADTDGGMTSLALPADEVRLLLGQVPGVQIAAVNGPAATVVSGAVTGLADLEARCEQRDIRVRRVPVTYASHSDRMEALRDELADLLAPVRPRTGDVPIFSTLRGELVDGADLDASYWFANLRHTVQLEPVISQLAADGVGAFAEMSPHPVLTGAVTQTVEAAGAAAVVSGSLRRDQGGLSRLQMSAAELFVQGVPIALDRWVPTGNRVDLPAYAFQRRRFWLGSPGGADVRATGLTAGRHPLIAGSMRLADDDGVVLVGRLSLRSHPWLADHAVGDSVLVPATAFVELAVRAGDEAGYDHIDELTLHTPLTLPRRGGVHVQVVLRAPDDQGRGSLTIHSRPDDAEPDEPYVRHAAAVLTAGERAPVPARSGSWPPAGAEPIEVDGVYERLASGGYHYGPVFQGLRAAWQQDGNVYAEVALAEGTEVDGFALHPALFDAALQAVALVLGGDAGDRPRLPFAFTGVTVRAAGATSMRVRLTRDGDDTMTLYATDPAGAPVVTVDALVTRPVADVDPGVDDALFRVDLVPLELPPAADVRIVAWDEAITGRSVEADVVVYDGGRGDGGSLPGAVWDSTVRLLDVVQRWLADERFADARLAVVTHQALTLDGETPDLTRAALVGLLRSAQAEHPGRFVLVDTGVATAAPDAALATALGTGEPEILLRGETAYVPRLVRAPAPSLPVGLWRLDVGVGGSVDSLAVVSTERRGLAAREVRVAVRAAGVNFRDVLLSLGMYPGVGSIGGEAAGVVLEVGDEVTGLCPGDRVMGLFIGAFGPEAVGDERMLVGVPDGWSFAEAATVPVAFATAWFGLRDLGGLRSGQRVLIHAAAGGVGQAAVQLARYWGAEVFGTASAGKWEVLRGLGLDDGHIGSSRDLSFVERFPAGFDVVLNSLAGEFVDASLGLLAPGGRFVEMGKTDVREPEGVDYRAFDLAEAGLDRTQEILADVAGLMACGALRPLPLRAFDMRRASDAFRLMVQGRHVGKVVLTPPREAVSGSVVVTGATGTLGQLVAEHLAAAGVGRLLLLSRSGEVAGLRERLTALGAEVTFRACDVADREELAAALAGVPVSGVVHAAGVLADGVLESMTPEQVEVVLRAKVDAAVHLHELTVGADLSMFVLYSSVAGVLGAAGQANYAAANAFLDALAVHRRGLGLAGTSLAWGFWNERSAMTGHLDGGDLQRLARGGIVGLTREHGLALFDAAVTHTHAALAPVRLDLRVLSREETPPILRSLLRTPARRTARATAGSAGIGLAAQLTAMSADERDQHLLALVRSSAAAVLGHQGADAIDAHRAFKDIGFDSLTAVELRNRITAATGLRLPTTLVFDHPSPTDLARRLRTDLVGDTDKAVATPVASTAAASEPIAVVGMGGRFGGGVDSVAGLWDLLVSGGEVVGEFPADRGWDVEGLFDPDPGALGKSYVRFGGFVSGVADFDAEFFGISPREALAMDPQQRLFLETAWVALEDAGFDPADLRGSRTGVFAGLSGHDYGGSPGEVMEGVEGHLVTGNAASVLSGRLSYFFGWEGPAVTVDTACSSSLVALHLAVQALRQGECGLALVGGVSVMSTPALFLEFSRQRGLAVDGRCKAFSADADGMGAAEGAGVLVVERLSDARRNGHRILAVVRGSAVNQDGASNGLTAPNGPSQQRVIRQALVNAGVDAAGVDVVEAHGTGTRLGDPIEAQALLETYGQDRERPLWLGSVKSNLGHTQAASGVAGVMKMILAMRHDLLPRTLHADVPTPEVDWTAGNVRLLTEAQPWKRNGHPRRAGVSSFGISGTNAHVVLEEGEPVEAAVPRRDASGVPLLLSAASPAALRDQALQLAELLAEGDVSLHDVASSLVRTRGLLAERAVVAAADAVTARDGLSAFAAGIEAPNVVAGHSAGRDERVVFVFPGQGAQWAGMGVALMAESPVFARRMAECEQALGPFVDWSLTEVLGDERALERVEVVQPALWAVMVSLAAVWRSWGVEPSAVVGHSQGEIAAACVAGALTLEDGARVVALRSAAIAGLAGTESGMTSVAMSRADVEELLEQMSGVSVAAVNGPSATVVAGEVTGLAQLEAACEQRGVRARRVPVTYASHSAQMESLREELARVLSPVRPRIGAIPFFSTLRGEVVDGAELHADYWFANLRHTVLLEPVITRLTGDGVGAFVEMSPHPVLTVPVTETVEAAGGRAVVSGSLRRDEGGLDRLLLSAGGLFVEGVRLDPHTWVPEGNRVDLPAYPFQRRRFWLAAAAGDVRSAGLAAARHPLIAGTMRLADGDAVVLTGRLSLQSHPWLADHAVNDTVLVPGTAFVELAVRAGDEAGYDHIEELALHAPLVLPRRGHVALQVVLRDGTADIYSRPDDGDDFTHHVTATLARGGADADAAPASWPPAGAEQLPVDGMYERLADGGYRYGPVFQGLRAAWWHDGSVYAEVAVPEGVETAGFALHPALFDAALQAISLVPAAAGGEPRLPFAFTGVTLHAVGATHLRVRVTRHEQGDVTVHAFDPAGAPVVTVGRLVTRPLTGVAASSGSVDGLWRVEWTAVTSAGEHDVTVVEFAELTALLDGSGAVAETMAVLLPPASGGNLAARAHRATVDTLDLLQRWLADERTTNSRLVLVTDGAVGPGLTDPAHAAVWGLVRSAQAEHHDRFVLVDGSADLLPAAVATGETEIVVRDGRLLVPGLARPAPAPSLPVGLWRLDVGVGGSVDSLAVVSTERRGLAAREVRVAVRAAGVNFRDVLLSLGMYPGVGSIGGEAAGVVLEVGDEVTGLCPGDRVMGLFIGAFGPEAVGDERMLVGVPDGWSFAEAATVPVAFATAWFGLRDLGGLRSGQRVLIHAAAGGVGQAAVQLARYWGAEVFGTASAGKWEVLRGLGLDDGHIGSSRDLSFVERFPAGFDVVLNSLAGEFVDASLGLLAPGGRFVEMGKTDVREPEGVDYRAFDLAEAGLDRTQEILADVAGLMACGALRPLPLRAFDMRRASDAFRLMVQGRHVGKVVLTPPREAVSGSVVVTGATGTLGQLVAEHLAAAGVGRLLLLSRSGEVAGLRERLTALGAEVTFRACDVADREELAAALAGVPVSGVVHAAGVLADGVLESMTPEQVEVVLRAKVDAAVHLHELTVGADLSMFVLYSSVAGVLGAAGQANYAAANAFLDALAVHRRGLGLAGTSLAWGFWNERSAMTGHLDGGDLQRLARGGIVGLTREHGLALFDTAVHCPEPALVAARLDLRALHRDDVVVPPLMRGLVRAPARRAAAAGTTAAGFTGRLAALLADDREQHVLDLVRAAAAAVLGHHGADAIDAHRAFKDIGFDSLTAVELRNRITAATGLRLPTTLVFDHPTPAAISAFVLAATLGTATEPNSPAPVVTAADIATDPIVIVGMSCRFPGGVGSPEQLWQLLVRGGDAVGPFPTDRGWDLERLYHPDPEHPGTTYTREGAFLGGAADFDPGFFGISPREAIAMDPQQRLLLEVSWEALENAGIDPATLRGSRTGVFAGASGQDYTGLLARVPERVKGHLMTGNTGSVVSGRISYTFGLEGPAMTVDTACSSSLVALHLAAQALRQGECTLALAGGVTVMSTPGFLLEFSRQRGLARDGRCKAFSADADGMGAAEGAGMLLLERLSDARRHGHQVLAVIRGSAVNQDGASNGLTAPNGPSQQRVIQQALAVAGLRPADVDAVEAHGTGTRLGDPIEAQALLATYGQDREQPVRIGSIKSNIGHTQAAAGAAGVIKMVLALRHGLLPRTLHAAEPSPHVDWSAGAAELLTRPQPWEADGRPRRGGVSSFGISGTNAHVILEEAPSVPAEEEPAPDGPASTLVPWILSAKSAEALRDQADRLAAVGGDPRDVAHALLTKRALFDHRAVVLGRTSTDLIAGLHALPAGVRRDGKLALTFTGQGAQRAGMGRELAATFPLFSDTLDEICAVFDRHLGRPLRRVIDGEADLLDRTEYTQPALVVLEIALYRLLGTFGIRPAVLAGHSIGEFTAAHVAGILSLDDTAALVCARGRLMQALPEGGAMLALAVTEAEALTAIDGRAGIAAVNGPSSVVISGDAGAVEAVAQRFEGRRRKLLRTSHAFHSPLMTPMLDEFRAVAESVTYAPAGLPIVSTVTGRLAEGDDLRSADYWVRHAVAPVRFHDAVLRLHEFGAGFLLEVGPDGTLTSIARDLLPDDAVLEPALRRDRPEEDTLLGALARLHTAGVPVDWRPVVPLGRRVDLPTYAFQHRRLWLTDAITGLDLGDPVVIAGDGVLFDAVLPRAGGVILELLLRAGDEVGCDLIEEAEFLAPLPAVAGGTRVQIRVRAADPEGRRAASISSYDGGHWTVNATAILAADVAADLALDEGEIIADVALADPEQAGDYLLHPDLLEGLPFTGWRGVRLHATGAHHLVVRLSGEALVATDTEGEPVLTASQVTVGSLGPESFSEPLSAPRPVRRAVRPAESAAVAGFDPATALDLVRSSAAAVLGHETADALDDQRSLLELGFDSLTATELRRRLVAATGVPLEPTVVFDEPSLAALARHLAARAAGPRPEAAGTVSSLYWQACVRGRLDEGLALVQAAARLRPAFDVATAEQHVPGPVRLASVSSSGGGLPLICLPSFSAVAGPHEFAPFAGALRGSRDVWALPEPGYLEGEALPESLDALVRMQAEAVRRLAAGGDGFVVVGRSMSGMLAYALTAHLESVNLPPAAVVLLDSSTPASIRRRPWLSSGLAQAVADRESGMGLRSDTRITAMGRYHEIFAGWEPAPVATRTLLVRATEPWSSVEAGAGGWGAEWDLPHETVDVPGDHFTILEAAAASTALAVDGWLGGGE